MTPLSSYRGIKCKSNSKNCSVITLNLTQWNVIHENKLVFNTNFSIKFPLCVFIDSLFCNLVTLALEGINFISLRLDILFYFFTIVNVNQETTLFVWILNWKGLLWSHLDLVSTSLHLLWAKTHWCKSSLYRLFRQTITSSRHLMFLTVLLSVWLSNSFSAFLLFSQGCLFHFHL